MANRLLCLCKWHRTLTIRKNDIRLPNKAVTGGDLPTTTSRKNDTWIPNEAVVGDVLPKIPGNDNEHTPWLERTGAMAGDIERQGGITRQGCPWGWQKKGHITQASEQSGMEENANTYHITVLSNIEMARSWKYENSDSKKYLTWMELTQANEKMSDDDGRY